MIIIKDLELDKIWRICNKLSYEEAKFSEEKGIYVSLLGYRSSYSSSSFENFLSYYSFKIEDDNIVIFNNDGVPHEDYSNDDFSYIPICLLYFSAEKLDEWIENEIELQLEKQEREKLAEKENIKLQIERLTKQLNTL